MEGGQEFHEQFEEQDNIQGQRILNGYQPRSSKHQNLRKSLHGQELPILRLYGTS